MLPYTEPSGSGSSDHNYNDVAQQRRRRRRQHHEQQKQQEGEEEEEQDQDQTAWVFVHTLNTESGLLRKVAALGVGATMVAALPPPASNPRTAAFRVVLRLLPFLTHDEQNLTACLMVRWAWRRLGVLP